MMDLARVRQLPDGEELVIVEDSPLRRSFESDPRDRAVSRRNRVASEGPPPGSERRLPSSRPRAAD
jgi:hypothetical protein